MKTEIIAVGTELLLGQVVNTNAAFLSEQLADYGFEVYFQTVVGDNAGRLEEVLEIAENRSECIILCGGLGPTEDDLTKQVVAKHLQTKLVRDETAYQKLLENFAVRNSKMTENNLRQAEILEGSRVLENDNGLAVGSFYRTGDKNYFLLPGPPSELKTMVANYVIPILKEINPHDERLFSRVLRFYGIGESRLVTILASELAEQTNPSIAPYAKENEVTLRLTAKALTLEDAQKLLDQTEQKILAKTGEFFYGYGDDNSLVQATVQLAKAKGKSITAAESLTAGLFQSMLGEISGVSKVFAGGFVTYSAEMKHELLGISQELLDKYGVVSRECAEAMAQQAARIVGSDFAVSFTGVAGPEKLEGYPAGTVWIALAQQDRVLACEQFHFTRGRQNIRHAAVMAGLNMLRKELCAC